MLFFLKAVVFIIPVVPDFSVFLGKHTVAVFVVLAALTVYDIALLGADRLFHRPVRIVRIRYALAGRAECFFRAAGEAFSPTSSAVFTLLTTLHYLFYATPRGIFIFLVSNKVHNHNRLFLHIPCIHRHP